MNKINIQCLHSSTRNLFVSFACLLLHLPTTFAQNTIPNPFVITAGIDLVAQDRRLFFWPGREGILEREKSFVDYGYNISAQKKVFQYHKIGFYAGIGYSEYNTTFSRPFAQKEFGILTKEIRYVKRYTVNKIIVPLQGVYCLGASKKIRLHLLFLPNFTFRKSAKDLNFKKRETKWGFDFTALEVYVGVSKQVNERLRVGVNYRALYLNRIDPVIFYQSLFYTPNPAFLQKTFDLHNPFKLWFTAEYRLGK